MAIIKQLNKKTGITYVYESRSYRDKETKQPRSERRLIGRIDDATGEIVPTRKKSKNVTTDSSEDFDTTTTEAAEPVSLDTIREKDAVITRQRREISWLLREREELAAELGKLVERLRQ